MKQGISVLNDWATPVVTFGTSKSGYRTRLLSSYFIRNITDEHVMDLFAAKEAHVILIKKLIHND